MNTQIVEYAIQEHTFTAVTVFSDILVKIWLKLCHNNTRSESLKLNMLNFILQF